VEDEREMAAALARGLREERHTVVVASDGMEGLDLAARHDFDVVLLDVLLPRMSGLDVARRLRGAGNTTPIVMLTARDSVRDIVTGLDCGADDYVTKPFSFEELLARLRSAARHRRGSTSRLTVADLVLDPAVHAATRAGVRLALSATEFRLLEYLMRRAGQVVPRETLLEAIWGFEDVEANTLEQFIHLLRAKVDCGSGSKLIRTVRGVGYSIEP